MVGAGDGVGGVGVGEGVGGVGAGEGEGECAMAARRVARIGSRERMARRTGPIHNETIDKAGHNNGFLNRRSRNPARGDAEQRRTSSAPVPRPMESGVTGKALFVRAFFDGAASSDEYKHSAAAVDDDASGRPRRVTVFADPLTVRKQQGIQAIERAMERQRCKEASKKAWAEAAAEEAAAAAEAAARNGRLCNLCRDDGQDSLEATAHPGGRMGAIYDLIVSEMCAVCGGVFVPLCCSHTY